MRVTVLGAGVVGLTVAARLVRDGHEVTVRAAATGEATTSSVAAALWYPYLAAPAEATRRWGAATYLVLHELAATTPEAGVDVRRGVELRREDAAPPDWHDDVRGFGSIAVGDGYSHGDASPAAHGWSFEAPVVDMSVYLPWLEDHVRRAGAVVLRGEQVTRETLRPIARGQHALVLATGLGSRQIAGDESVRPVRGQVVLLGQVGVTRWQLDESDPQHPTYVVPRRDVIVCGGTALSDRWDTEPDQETADAVLRRCVAMVGELAEAPVLGSRVGLRPVRPAVRLERDDSLSGGEVPVVVCYGHGGAGVTLSWGCADEVATLLPGTG